MKAEMTGEELRIAIEYWKEAIWFLLLKKWANLEKKTSLSMVSQSVSYFC